jgi:hypothetical protein
MTDYRRCGFRWTINEILSLQREYELLEWTVQQIAAKHERSVMAILCKLEAEGFISNWQEARGFDANAYQNSFNNASVQEDAEDEEISCADNDSEYLGECEEEEEEEDMDFVDDASEDASEVDKLTERVWNLETSVQEIGSMVKQMFENMVYNKTASKKRAPLRNY